MQGEKLALHADNVVCPWVDLRCEKLQPLDIIKNKVLQNYMRRWFILRLN
jgi:hypothetical protein